MSEPRDQDGVRDLLDAPPEDVAERADGSIDNDDPACLRPLAGFGMIPGTPGDEFQGPEREPPEQQPRHPPAP